MEEEVRELVPVKVVRKEEKVEQPKPIEELPEDWHERLIPRRWKVGRS